MGSGLKYQRCHWHFVIRNAVSWGLGAVVMGAVTDRVGFDANFTLYGLFSFASIAIIAWKVPNQTHLEKSIEYVQRQQRCA
jgi:hypothetical protein